MKSANTKKTIAKKPIAKLATPAQPPAAKPKARSVGARTAPAAPTKTRPAPAPAATTKPAAQTARGGKRAAPETAVATKQTTPAAEASPAAKAVPIVPAAPRAQERSKGKGAAAPQPTTAKKPVSSRAIATEATAKSAPKSAPKPAPAAVPPPAPSLPPLSRSDIPPILFEGDDSPVPALSGPGHRFALAPLPPLAGTARAAAPTQLPESYGTRRLLLTARDPHWLYAHWDLSREQQQQFNAQSRDGHLVLRILKDWPEGGSFQEIDLHPESRSWFVHVGLGNTQFFAELGCYDRGGAWQSIAKSAGTFTPPDALSEDTSARFETLPPEVKFEELVAMVKAVVSENVPLMEALLQLRTRQEMAAEVLSLPPLPPALVEALAQVVALAAQGAAAIIEWTPERERALAQIISMDSVRRVWMGSLEITELIRRQLPLGISSGEAPQFSRPAAGPGLGVSGGAAARAISSPGGGIVEQRPGFWFNVNAELILYGATEPGASVTIGGRKIKLRPDGSFSYRFALPDGHYELPAIAIAADNSERRSADLRFSRSTEYCGEVTAHPQDPALKPPQAEHLS